MHLTFRASREDNIHMKQLRGLKAIEHSEDDVSLEGPSRPKWKGPAQPISVPSNARDIHRHGNPFSRVKLDNLHEERGSSSSGSGHSNPNSTTVITSHHFGSSSLDGLDKHNFFRDNKKEETKLYHNRPAKRRKTDSSSIIPSSTFSNPSRPNNGKHWPAETSSIIDLVDEEDVGEPISSGPPSAMILSSPLTPTVSSDDIGLRSNDRRLPSPSVSDFTDHPSRSNSPVHPASNDGEDNQNPSHSIGSKLPEGKGDTSLSGPYTRILTDRFQDDPIDNADDFDNLSLKDPTPPRPRRNGASTRLESTEIPRGLVKSSVKNIEALTTSSIPPLWDVNKAKRKNLIHNMQTRDSGQLRRASFQGLSAVPKPPSKPDSAISTTDFTRSKGSGGKRSCYPLMEYAYEGRAFKTTDEHPYSARFTDDDLAILDKDSLVRRFPKSSFNRVIYPGQPPDFSSDLMVIFWSTSESDDGDKANGLGLRFQPLKPGPKNSELLRNIWNLIIGFSQGYGRRLVTKGIIFTIWPTLLYSEGSNESTNSSPIIVDSPTKKAKPRPTPVRIPATRSATGNSTTRIGGSSKDTSRAKKSPSPSHEELILVYPPSGIGALNLTYGDLKRLEPGEFLNDTLIEFGLKLWLNDFRNRESELADQIHVFSSFFYTQLRQKNLEEGYQNVRKWTSKVDIFKKNYIIVPINERLHWYLAIICYPGRILERSAALTTEVNRPSSDSDTSIQDRKEVEILTNTGIENSEAADLAQSPIPPPMSPSLLEVGSPIPRRSITRSASPPDPVDIISNPQDPMDVDDPVVDTTTGSDLTETPLIFTFDSLGSRHPVVLKTLNSYLHMEAKDKKDFAVSVDAHTAQALVPTQPNSCDCGIYLLHFVEQFMSDPERFIKHILNKPLKKASSIVISEREQLWNAAEVAGKREALKQKVLILSAEWKQIRKPDDKGKGKEEAQPSGPPTERKEDSDIEVLEVTPAPSTRPNKQRAQRLR